MQTAEIAVICEELQKLQRRRREFQKIRIMQENCLGDMIGNSLGYASGMSKEERKAKRKEAKGIIKMVYESKEPHHQRGLIENALYGILNLRKEETLLEKEMRGFADKLHVVEWCKEKEQRGFGTTSRLFLAVLIGETGDLFKYANPAKVWRRMGCAAWTFNNKTLMGKSWRMGLEGSLPADEWEKFGYCPRRRSVAYLIGENLMKLNGDGPYRTRYDLGKAIFKEKHPDYCDLRCHLHGMLLATKLLLKNLWIAWRREDEKIDESDQTVVFSIGEVVLSD